MFKVEKKVDAPTSYSKRVEYARMLEKMEVGDSFLIPKESENLSALRQYPTGWGRNLPNRRTFASRIVDGGVRVWRMS